MNQTATASWSEVFRSGYFGTLLLLCLGVWLHAADSLMITTIMPLIVADLGASAWVAWSFSLYEIGSIVAGAASGLLTLRFGTRRAMTVAALVYALGCVLSALAPNMALLLAGRLMQGSGGGGLVALTLITVVAVLPERLAARGVASISVVWGISAFTGPLVGGVFAELDWWRGALGFFAVQALVFALLIFNLLKQRDVFDTTDNTHFPVKRLALLGVAVIAIATASVHIEAVQSTLLLVAGLALFYWFTRIDDAHQVRLLPRQALNIRTGPGAANVLMLCYAVATIALTVFGPLLMTVLHGLSPLKAGYVVALSSIGWSVMAILTSSSPPERDRIWILAGALTLIISICGLLWSMAEGPMWIVAVCAFLEGAGFGMAWTFILRTATAAAQPDDRQRVPSALYTVHRLGYAVGAALMGLIANAAGFIDGINAQSAASVARWLFAGSLLLCLPGLVAARNLGRLAGRSASP